MDHLAVTTTYMLRYTLCFYYLRICDATLERREQHHALAHIAYCVCVLRMG